jgi:hypothetical protein
VSSSGNSSGGVTDGIGAASCAGPGRPPLTSQTSAFIKGLASWVTLTSTEAARRVSVSVCTHTPTGPEVPRRRNVHEMLTGRGRPVRWPAARRAMAARYPPHGPMVSQSGFSVASKPSGVSRSAVSLANPASGC